MNRQRFHLSLLTRFSLLSLIAFVLIGLTLGYALRQRLTANALEQEAATAIEQAQTIIAPLLVAADLDGLPPAKLAALDEEIRARVLNRRVFRVKIWNARGMLIYADERELIGQTFPLSDELKQAFAGHTAMDVSSLDRPENASERGASPRAFEIYAPIIPRDSARALGAYEIYARLEPVAARIAVVEQTLFGGLALGFLALYLALFAIVRGASRELVRRSEENAQLYALEQRRAHDLQAINDVGQRLAAILSSQELTDEILHVITQRFSYDRAALYLTRDRQIVATIMRGYPAAYVEQIAHLPKISLNVYPLVAQSIASGRTLLLPDVRIDSRGMLYGPDDPTLAQIALPLTSRGRMIGVLVISSNRANAFEQSDTLLLEMLSAQIAVALENAGLYEATQKNVRQLRALRTIDHAISAALELERILEILLDQAIAHIGQTDAAGLVVLTDIDDPDDLHIHASRNLSKEFLEAFAPRLNTSLAAGVLVDGMPRVIANMANDLRIQHHDLRLREKLHSLVLVPMRVQGKPIGTLELFTRQPYTPSDEDLNFYVTLGGQAAIATQNAQLSERHQRQTASLTDLARQMEESYTATLTAMSTALDLRDHETEGHAQRVAELAGWLARASGITDERDLRAIHYGALLHDIGKIGISDALLMKTEQLTDAEWSEIRRHAEIGARILRGIPFLRGSLPVVFSHHERWDGTGYPEQLAGEAIPLLARIFAIIDVYDALTSARPYRAAWNKDQAREYIHAHSGTWFDPHLVDIFLKLIKDNAL